MVKHYRPTVFHIRRKILDKMYFIGKRCPVFQKEIDVVSKEHSELLD